MNKTLKYFSLIWEIFFYVEKTALACKFSFLKIMLMLIAFQIFFSSSDDGTDIVMQ